MLAVGEPTWADPVRMRVIRSCPCLARRSHLQVGSVGPGQFDPGEWLVVSSPRRSAVCNAADSVSDYTIPSRTRSGLLGSDTTALRNMGGSDQSALPSDLGDAVTVAIEDELVTGSQGYVMGDSPKYSSPRRPPSTLTPANACSRPRSPRTASSGSAVSASTSTS